MRLHPLLLTLTVLAVLPSTVTAAAPGDTLLASGLPGLGAPNPADFAFNVSGRGLQGDDASQSDMTADGTRVAFTSLADGLVSTPEARRYDNVFVKDLVTRQLIPVAPGANGSSRYPSISDDGTKVVFETAATNLVPNDTTPDADVILRDLTTGTYKLISSPGDDGCAKLCALPELSGNGLYVAFGTKAQLLPALDANTRRDVYRVPTGAGATVLVDRADGAGGATASIDASAPSISDDGNRITFATQASGLGAGASDGNGTTDVYLRDISGGRTFLVSAADTTNAAGNSDASNARLSGDGTVVTFDSQASNLIAPLVDTGGDYDVFARIVGVAGTGQATQLVSRSSGGAQANDRSYFSHVNDAGTLVTFVSEGTNLGGGFRETYARTLPAGPTVRLGAGEDARVLELSGDGAQRFVDGGRFTPQLEPGLSVITAAAATRQVVSRDSADTPLVRKLEAADYYSGPRAVSATGRYVAFLSSSPGLPGARNFPGAPDEYVTQAYRRDQQTGAVELISRVPGTALGADGSTASVAISADGDRVAFLTYASLVAADTNGGDRDAYVRDVAADTTTLASRADGPNGAVSGAGDSIDLSADGRHVAFQSRIGGPDDHVYVRDLTAGSTTLADRADGAAGVVGNGPGGAGYTRGMTISRDGTKVAFETTATNLGDGDSDTKSDIHLRDLAANTTTLVSRRSGVAGAKSASSSGTPVISADGRRVAFASSDVALDPSVSGAPALTREVYVRDVVDGTTTLVSRGAGAGPMAGAAAETPAISADGAVVAYASSALNLGNPSAEKAVFVRRLATGTQDVVAVTSRSDLSESSASAGVLQPSLNADGDCVSFTGWGTGLVTGVSPDFRQLFTRLLSGDCGTVAAAQPGPPVLGAPAPKPPVGSPKPPLKAKQRPRISALRLTRSAFRVSPRSRTKARKVKKAGTRLSYRLNVPATVTIVVQRRTSGRKVGRSCRKATKKLRKRKRCVRYVTTGRVLRKAQKAGTVKVSFSGRFGRRGLVRGRYRFSLVATAGGLRSPTVTRSFRIIR